MQPCHAFICAHLLSVSRACGSFSFHLLYPQSFVVHPQFLDPSTFACLDCLLVCRKPFIAVVPAFNDLGGFVLTLQPLEGSTMEKAIDPEIPLTILHHDEHLVFPGYNVMVGQSRAAQDEEHKRTSGKPGAFVAPAGGRNRCRPGMSIGNRKLLVIAVIIWCAVFFLRSLPKRCNTPTPEF